MESFKTSSSIIGDTDRQYKILTTQLKCTIFLYLYTHTCICTYSRMTLPNKDRNVQKDVQPR